MRLVIARENWTPEQVLAFMRRPDVFVMAVPRPEIGSEAYERQQGHAEEVDRPAKA